MKPRIPFITTFPETDIFWIWGLLPVWYILGLDQIVWLPATFLIITKIFLLRSQGVRYVLPDRPFFKALFFFFLVCLMTVVFVVLLDLKFFLYLKSLLTYLAGFTFIVVMVNTERSGYTEKIMKTLCVVGLIAVVINLAAITGVLSYSFDGLISYVLPKSLMKSDFFSKIVHKSPFEEDKLIYHLGFLTIARPRSIFFTANFFAGYLLILLCLLYYYYLKVEGIMRKVSLIFLMILSLLSLGTTLSRSALLGFGVAFIRMIFRRNISVVLKAGLVASLLLFGIALNFIFQLGDALTERGVSGRERLYEATISEVLHFPIFGHGVTMASTSEAIEADLGSHSTVMNILFSQGLFGLSFYFVMVGYLYYSLERLLKFKLKASDQLITETFLYILIATSIQTLFITWQFCTVYFMGLMTIWGAAARHIIIKQKEIAGGLS